MTGSGKVRRLRLKGAITAVGVGAAAIAIGTLAAPTETLASFADNVWAGGQFSTGKFGLQTSLTANGPFSDGPKDLMGSTTPGTVSFSTPIALAPGATSYAPVYLRTSEGTTTNATVGISTAAQRPGMTSNSALWGTTSPIAPGFITYAARAVPVPNHTSPPQCGSGVFSTPTSTWLFGNGTNNPSNVALSTASTATQTFPLSAAATSTYMVCFRFALASSVTGTTSANGASVYPVWTFTGNQSAS